MQKQVNLCVIWCKSHSEHCANYKFSMEVRPLLCNLHKYFKYILYKLRGWRCSLLHPLFTLYCQHAIHMLSLRLCHSEQHISSLLEFSYAHTLWTLSFRDDKVVCAVLRSNYVCLPSVTALTLYENAVMWCSHALPFAFNTLLTLHMYLYLCYRISVVFGELFCTHDICCL